jgi:hypothetical protein
MIILAAIRAHRSFAGAHASRRGQRTSERQAHPAAAVAPSTYREMPFGGVTAVVGSAIGADTEVDRAIAAYEVAVKHLGRFAAESSGRLPELAIAADDNLPVRGE